MNSSNNTIDNFKFSIYDNLRLLDGKRARVLQTSKVCGKNFYYLSMSTGLKVWKEEKELIPLMEKEREVKSKNYIDLGGLHNHSALSNSDYFAHKMSKENVAKIETLFAPQINGAVKPKPKEEIISGIEIHRTLTALENQMRFLIDDIKKVSTTSAKVLEKELNCLKSKYDRIVLTLNSFKVSLID